jgi:hypothetical protein
MQSQFTYEEWQMLTESMEYTLRAFQNTGIAPHGSYPSYEFKCHRVKEARDLLNKLRALKKEHKRNDSLA